MQLQAKHALLVLPLVTATLAGCTRDYKFQPVDMWNESRFRPYESVDFFEDNKVARTPPQGTVARGQARVNEVLYYGTRNGELVDENPILAAATTPQARLAVLQRGQERFNIYCQPCHGLNGAGDGLIIKRGFAKPPSYHIERLREAPDGYLFDVITNGYGSMYSYASRVPTRDRWAIVAYIRTLQRSQNARPGDVPPGIEPSKGVIEPPLGEELRYLGPSAGGEYHGVGAGNTVEDSDIEIETEQSAR